MVENRGELLTTEALARTDYERPDPGPLGPRVYTSRLLGRDKSLVLHGGGNTSVKLEEKNLFDTKLSDATVLTLYLLPRINLELRPRILSELKPGTRVVSHAFDMGDWEPDRTEQVNGRKIFLWTVPARA